ncbi:MAG: TonB family protein [Acidobacteria bacterium]|nr:TonB family protein [Acidobacteriota bacterium]
MPEKYRTVGSYVLFKEIAEDVLGHVYRAGKLGETSLERVVWLRLFDGPAVPKDDLAGAFDQAAEIGASLKATNIAPNPAYFVHDGIPGLAWDDAPGQPLGRVFDKTSEEGFPVPVDNALLIVEKVALALSSGLAVEVGGVPLAHGFLTPEMVLVTNDGEALVAGFGLGDALLGSLNDETIRQAVAGYIAPEVLTSRIPGKRGDVYSLGSLLFRLLTGRSLPAAPQERSGALIAAELAYGEGPIPQDIMGLLTRALADRPEDRFSSAADFKKELDKLLFGGAYSPTTFNLALFMDRLFRPEIEAEQGERAEEQGIDVSEYLHPESEPVVMPETGAVQTETGGGGKKGAGLWIGIGVIVVVVAAAVGFFVLKPAPAPQLPPPTPTPTAAQIAAQKAAQQKQVEALVEQQVNQMMAQREQQIRQELLARQAQIAKLQQQLQKVKKAGGSNAEQQRKARQIQQQIAAQKRAAQAKAAALEAARKKAEAEAERKIKEEQAKATPSSPPTAVPAARPTALPTPTPAIREGQFVDPTQVDTRPVLLKMEPVVWPPSALRSHRRGVIIMSATVNAHGFVTAVKILRADDKILGIPQAAVAAAKKYIFKPATKSGVKVTTTTTVTVPYAFNGMVP